MLTIITLALYYIYIFCIVHLNQYIVQNTIQNWAQKWMRVALKIKGGQSISDDKFYQKIQNLITLILSIRIICSECYFSSNLLMVNGLPSKIHNAMTSINVEVYSFNIFCRCLVRRQKPVF